MKITINVKPNAKREGVEPGADGALTVRVGVPPIEGKANERVVELLAKHFGVPKSRVTILRGTSGRKKVVEIAG